MILSRKMCWQIKSDNFWKTIKPYLSKKNTSGPSKVILTENSKLITKQNEVSEIFNSFFTNVANDIGDILIITEIYPKMGKSTDITEEELHIDNYNLFRSNVKESSRGVAIYVKDTLSSSINLDLTDHLFSESVWVNIHINNKDNFLIGGVYRSPQSSIENNDLLLDLLQKTKDTTYSNILIMGDFNLPEINWDLWTTTRSETHISYKFLECLRDNFWEQAIFSPIRWVNDQPGNVLDLCLTDNLEIIKNIEITTRLGNSDHLSIEAELIFPKKVSKSYAEKRNYYKGDYMSANEKLSNINWSCMNEKLTVFLKSS